MHTQSTLQHRKIFAFWFPLATMWIMMSAEQPLIAAFTTRLPQPELNLAALGITMPIAFFIEGPAVMLLTAGTALARDAQSYQRLLRFTHLLALGLTVIYLTVGLTPLYDFIVISLIGAPAEILELSRHGFLLLTPWVSAVAYRLLWQGVLIRFNRTAVVPLTIAARLVTLLCILALGLMSGAQYQGIYLGTFAMSISSIVAALVAYWLVQPIINESLQHPAPTATPLLWSELFAFYIPLALTTMIEDITRPMFSVVLARATDPLASLAVWPVIMGFLFMGRSVAYSYHVVIVVLLHDHHSFVQLQRFTLILAFTLTVLFVLAAVTPIAQFWYATLSGLPQRLVAFSMVPTIIVAIVPGINVLISWQRGLLVHEKRTQLVTRAVAFNAAVLAIAMTAALQLIEMPGAIIAAATLTLAVSAELCYLVWRSQTPVDFQTSSSTAGVCK